MTGFSLEFCEDIWCDLGGVTNHIKSFMLHLLKDQRDLHTEGPLNESWILLVPSPIHFSFQTYSTLTDQFSTASG